MQRRVLWAALAALSALAMPSAHAQDFPAALAAAGLSPATHACLLAWEERAPDGSWVQGFRVQALTDGATTDLYSDETGTLLDPNAQLRAGLSERPWDAVVSRPAEFVWDGARAAAASPVPVGATLKQAAPMLQIPAPDLDLALMEDTEDPKDLRRTGLIQPLPVPIRVSGGTASAGLWTNLPDGGRLWQLTLSSPGARGLRVHLNDLELPSGVAALVYATADPAQAHALPRATTEHWTPTVFSEDVTLEVIVPAGAAEPAFGIDALVYQYVDLLAEASEKAAGSCNLDVSCHAGFAQTALGVGGIGTVGASGSLWCTGALLVDDDPNTAIPYFLTADHCVSTQSKASSVEVYWFYQNSACAVPATPPAANTVPRTTGGADLLARSSVGSGTDFALLQLRNAPPNGVTYLGFSTSPAATGTEAVCIHHPRGDFKRISFGTKTATGSPGNGNLPLQPAARFHEILWHDGTTEPGSSGSPLFLANSQQLIGQLWGGRASCTKPEEPDYYGRFDVTYPVVAPWLGAPVAHPFDIDGSGALNAVDVQLVVNAALGRTVTVDADLDESGRVDAVDVQLIVRALLAGK
jgi:hypothetical protein